MGGVGNAFFGDCEGSGGTGNFEGEGIQLGGSGTMTANSTSTTVQFDTIATEHPSSSIYTFDDGNDTIEVGEDGLYRVSYHVGMQTGTIPAMLAVTNIRVRMEIEVDTGSGFSRPTPGIFSVLDLVLIIDNQRHVMSNSILLELSAGDLIRLRSGRASGTVSNTLLLAQCALAVSKVK